MKKIAWYAKQLLPLTYRSKYKTQNGNSNFAVWRMWFGKVFEYENFIILNEGN